MLAFFIRFVNLDKHFSHADDLIAPHYASMSVDYFLEKADKKVEISNTKKDTIRTIYPYIKPLIVALVIGKSSTYAPLQFIVTGAIVDKSMSYHDILFNSRLISLIMGFLSILLIAYIYLKLYGKDHIAYAIFGVTILSFSWEHIIYSMQSESYTIGLFVALLSFILYGKYVSKDNLSKKESLLLGVFLSLFIFSNYQFLFFLPGFYLAILISYKKEYKKFFSSYLLSMVVVLFSTLLVYKVFLSTMLSRGINWNAGLNKEFLFDLFSQNNVFESIGYVLSFFTENAYYVFRNLISFASEGSIFNDLVAIVYILLFIIGVFYFYISKNMLKKHFVYFFLVTILVWIVLVVVQKLTLSPTRHSLILFSFILIFTPAGLIYILEKYRINKNLTIVAFSMVIVFMFAIDYRSTMDKRLDKFDPIQIEKLIKKYNIAEIYEYGYTWNLDFMKYIKHNFNKKVVSQDAFYLFNKNLQKNNNILFITHRKKVLNKEIKKNFLKISDRSLGSLMKIIYKEEHKSNTEICFGDQTKNGTNSLFIYVVHIGEE